MARRSRPLRKFVCTFVIIVLGSTATTTALAAESAYIFEIPAERYADSDQPLGDYILATLDYANPQRAATQIAAGGALDVIDVTDSSVVVGIGRNVVTTGALIDANLAETFVVDFNEESVVSAARLLRDNYGNQPSPSDIETFVFEYIDDKSYLGTFDFASRVARTRTGDCTEHAVLLAALARTLDLPARLVMGVVLIAAGDRVDAYGHAWTEVYFEDRWQLLDGTAPASQVPDEVPYYLPLLKLEDEGPGYGMDFMRLMDVHPARISEIQAAKR